jgi:hypothetical protein
MTVINNIEIDNVQYHRNVIKDAIANNEPIENKLNVIIVVSNPCLFARRYILLKEFVQRMELEESNVSLYIVELAYGNHRFYVTDPKNKNHLQLRAEHPIWHKENMINIGIKKLLPPDWKAVAWVDADIEFENPTWAIDTLKILNGSKDIIQLFSHAVDMYRDETNIHIFNGFGYSFCKKKKYSKMGSDFWHPGFAWAMTRKAYERVGIYDHAILGSGDHVIGLSLINKVDMQTDEYSQAYKNDMLAYQSKAKGLRVGYVPGVIRHYYHGSKKNRQYAERWKILIKYGYEPSMIEYKDGIIVPGPLFPQEFCDEIMQYFLERNEDE